MSEAELKAASAAMIDKVASILAQYQEDTMEPYLHCTLKESVAEDMKEQAVWLFSKSLRLLMQTCERLPTPKALVALAEAVEAGKNK